MKRPAFSLIELMIVIVIMGLVYSMVTINTGEGSKKLNILSPLTIADTLRSFTDEGRREFIIYGDECHKALFLPEVEDLQIDRMEFSPSVAVYVSDAYGDFQPKAFAPIELDEREEKVCYRIIKYPNGSVTPQIVKNGTKYYVINPYFDKTQSFSSLQAAIEGRMHADLNPDNLGLRRR